MTTSSQFFDINSDHAFFLSLQRAASKLRSQKVKATSDVLYLLMGVNHLRDWIAPSFKAKNQSPITPEQHFYAAIHDVPEFRVVNAMCNYSKHMRQLGYSLETMYGAMTDDYPDIDSVFGFDDGPPTGYTVNGRDLFEIIEVVLNYYKSEWYEKSSQ